MSKGVPNGRGALSKLDSLDMAVNHKRVMLTRESGLFCEPECTFE